MTRQEKQALIQRLHDIWSTGDTRSIHEVYAENFVAHFYPRNMGAEGFDDARYIPAEHQRQRMMKHFLQVAFADFPVHRIDPSGVDADQHLPIARMGARRVLIHEDVRPPVGIDAHRLHGFHVRDSAWFA